MANEQCPDNKNTMPAGVLPVIELRERWKTASLANGWRYVGDWWTPAVEIVAQSVVDSGDLESELCQLGRERSASGVDLVETIDDVTALVGLIHPTGWPADWIRALVTGWSEETCLPCRQSCVDPLTKLLPLGFLRTRIAELYRRTEFTDRKPNDHWVFVFLDVRSVEGGSLVSTVDYSFRSASDSLANMVIVGECLHDVLGDSEVLCAVDRGRAIAIVAKANALASRLTSLQELLAARLLNASDQMGALHTVVQPFPRDLNQALELVDVFVRS